MIKEIVISFVGYMEEAELSSIIVTTASTLLYLIVNFFCYEDMTFPFVIRIWRNIHYL